MKLHRFIGDFDLSQKTVEIKNVENIKQIKGVLRLTKGDSLILLDGKGRQAEVSIVSMSKEKIVCEIIKEITPNDPSRKVHLYLAVLKKENFELAVQKAVECGVHTITPIIAERTVKTGLNMARLNKIILEASEQCGRSMVPVLLPILDFSPALAFGSAAEEKTIFHLGDELYAADTNRVASAKTASIFIGPEGGFTDKEINEAKSSGYTGASLGKLTLRGETAAIVATYRAVQGI